MSEQYSPRVGDRVRVVLEGEVHSTGGDTPGDFTIGLNLIASDSRWVVSVEKIEPPVEVFRPGDRIRRREWGYELTLAEKGAVQHFVSGRSEFYPSLTGPFTSELFELVYRP